MRSTRQKSEETLRIAIHRKTYVAAWAGFVYVALIIDVFSRIIVGLRAAGSMIAELTLDALKQALLARKIKENLIRHSDRGCRYPAIRYSERLIEAGISASLGSVVDGYDNAMAVGAGLS